MLFFCHLCTHVELQSHGLKTENTNQVQRVALVALDLRAGHVLLICKAHCPMHAGCPGVCTMTSCVQWHKESKAPSNKNQDLGLHRRQANRGSGGWEAQGIFPTCPLSMPLGGLSNARILLGGKAQGCNGQACKDARRWSQLPWSKWPSQSCHERHRMIGRKDHCPLHGLHGRHHLGSRTHHPWLATWYDTFAHALDQGMYVCLH